MPWQGLSQLIKEMSLADVIFDKKTQRYTILMMNMICVKQLMKKEINSKLILVYLATGTPCRTNSLP